MYIHLIKDKKVVQVIVADDESFVKQNEEALKKEFCHDDFIVSKEQEADIHDEHDGKRFAKGKDRYFKEEIVEEIKEVIKK